MKRRAPDLFLALSLIAFISCLAWSHNALRAQDQPFDFDDLLHDLSEEARDPTTPGLTMKVGDVMTFNGIEYACTFIDDTALAMQAVAGPTLGERMYLSGGHKGTREAMAKRGVVTMPSVYQHDFGVKDPVGNWTGEIDDARWLAAIEKHVPPDWDDYVHMNYERPDTVARMKSNRIPPDDASLQFYIDEYVDAAEAFNAARPNATLGNWAWITVDKWIPRWVNKVGPGVKTWGNISEADRQTLFDKWRDPSLDRLYDSPAFLFMPSGYLSYEINGIVSVPDKQWHESVQIDGFEATIAIVAEQAAEHGRPVQLQLNCRFGGDHETIFGRAIPRDQLWRVAKMGLDQGWSITIWGINAAAGRADGSDGWGGYCYQGNTARRDKYRRVVTPELIAAGVEPDWDGNRDAICDYFDAWAIDLAEWMADQVEAHLAQ